jgi:hypothetical protein
MLREFRQPGGDSNSCQHNLKKEGGLREISPAIRGFESHSPHFYRTPLDSLLEQHEVVGGCANLLESHLYERACFLSGLS